MQLQQTKMYLFQRLNNSERSKPKKFFLITLDSPNIILDPSHVIRCNRDPTVAHRLANSKTKFWLKLRQEENEIWTKHKTRSPVTKVFKEMKTGNTFRMQHTKRLPPNGEMQNPIFKYEL